MNSAEGTDRHCFQWMALDAWMIDQLSYTAHPRYTPLEAELPA